MNLIDRIHEYCDVSGEDDQYVDYDPKKEIACEANGWLPVCVFHVHKTNGNIKFSHDEGIDMVRSDTKFKFFRKVEIID